MITSQPTFIELLENGVIIDSNTANQRLDRFLRKLFRPHPDIALSTIFKAIRVWQIKVKKQEWTGDETSTKPKKVKESYFLQKEDQIIFFPSFLEIFNTKNPLVKKKTPPLLTTYNLSDFQSRIISEDEERLVINKPAGIMIHPTQDSQTKKEASLYDLIKQYYSSRGFAWSMFQPNVAYRLDKDTSWLVIVAKTHEGLQHLNEQIREHKVQKEYKAIVLGNFPPTLECKQSLKKIVDKQFGRGKMVVCDDNDEYAQLCHTKWIFESSRTDEILGELSLVKVQLFTWRMHQIRAHFAYANYPVLGDIVYGIPSTSRKLKKNYNISRQLLHARRYSFEDMNWKALSFEAPLLEDMKSIMLP